MKRWLLVLMLLLAIPARAQQLNPGGSGGGVGSVTGPIIISSINNTVFYADQFPGASLDAKIANAESQCPQSGCTIDAGNLSGPQTWSQTVNITKPTKLLLNGQISYTGAPLANGLINVTQYIAGSSGADISCKNGTGVSFVNPANVPGGLNPANLLQQWQCYILTHPSGPLATIGVSSFSTNGTFNPIVVTATTASPPPFTKGQSIRISGVSAADYNGWVVVDSVSGNTFTFHRGVSEGTATTGTATAYMPVITIGGGVSNVRVHHIDFVANQNTGSVIWEGTGPYLANSLVNNEYDDNQMLNTDGVGNSGFGIEISSPAGMGENTNLKRVWYNNISGLAGGLLVQQSQIVAASILGNEFSFMTNGPVVQFDCYQCVQNQNIEYRQNVFWWNYMPANTPTMQINSGYQYVIENNDFEEPNPNNVAGVDDIDANQCIFCVIKNNVFLTGYVTGSTRYVINWATAGSSGRILDNHHSGPMTAFFNAPLGGNEIGFIDYENNEDGGLYGANTILSPAAYNLSGSGSGANYTTTSATFVPVDSGRLNQTVSLPSGTTLFADAAFSCSNNTAGQACCAAIMDGSNYLNMTYVTSTSPNSGNLHGMLPSDQKQHTISLQYASCGGQGTSTMENTGMPDRPHLIVKVLPSSGFMN